ncbi:MAG: hypothetical protein U0W24_11280 [Bacteroidales bacterium]
MKNTYKISLAVTLVVLIGATLAYFYIFHSAHKNTFDEKAVYSITADSLYNAFASDEQNANTKFLGKIIEVEGKLLSVKEMSESYQLTFVDEMAGVTCMIDSNYAVQQKAEILKLKTGDRVKIKGQCNGFLTDVQLDRCVLFNGN